MSLTGNVAYHLVAGIVPALHQYARLDRGDQPDRRVLLEDHDEIDRLQRRQHFGAGALVLNRARLALQPLHRGVAVEAHDQPVAGAARRGQHLDVAGVQDIETAVGETDPQPPLAPIRKLRIEAGYRRDDLFFRCEKCVRQDFSPQFG